MDPTLSEPQQRDVWENWLASEIRSDYFAERSARYLRQQNMLTWSTLLLSSGAVATLAASFHGVALAFSVLTAALSLLSLVRQNQRLSMECSDLSFRWDRLSSEYKSLWHGMYSQDAPEKFKVLDERVSELSKSSHTMPVDAKAMLKWQNHVERQRGLVTA